MDVLIYGLYEMGINNTNISGFHVTKSNGKDRIEFTEVGRPWKMWFVRELGVKFWPIKFEILQ